MPSMKAVLPIITMLMTFSLFSDTGVKIPNAPKDPAAIFIALGAPLPMEPATLPPISGARDPARPLVIIDPGHGGSDPGAISPTGRREKDVTLMLGRAIHAELAASPRIRVALTRDSDRIISLVERYEIARRLGADLFISIHADAAPHNEAAKGATIYTLSEVASDKEAAMLAARENGANVVGGADFSRDTGVNRILIDLAQREAMVASTNFARILYREAAPLFAFKPEYHRFASLVVLKAPDIPSILFESGYLTNHADEIFLQSNEGQHRIAQGIRKAIETYFARRALAST